MIHRRIFALPEDETTCQICLAHILKGGTRYLPQCDPRCLMRCLEAPFIETISRTHKEN